jgi:ABC-2 type transport system permease protein
MKSPIHMFWLVFRYEGRVLLADRSLWLVLAIFLTLIGYGLVNGLAETRVREHQASSLIQKQQKTEQSNIARLREVMDGGTISDPFANPADPVSMGSGMASRYAILPPLALAPLAFGQSDLLPSYFKVTNRSKATFMYDSEIENPWNLLSGHFDLAFVLIYIFPLLIFALSYNLLSAEREQGTLKMLLSQPLTLPALVFGKVAVRALPLLICACGVPIVVLLITRPETRHASQCLMLLAWCVLAATYGLFWFGLTVMVNALCKSSAANALILIASWVLLVLVVPVLLNILVSVASPTPSRIELATRTRMITIEGLNRYNKQLSTDYRYSARPETLLPKDGKIEIAQRRLGHFFLQKDVDKEIQTVLEQFSASLAGQQALLDRFGLISPAIVAYESTAALAGNGSRRHLNFQNQVDVFHQAWKQFFEPRILSGTAITESDFERMPRFLWQEEPGSVLLSDLLRHLLQLLLVTGLPMAFGLWKLRRYAVV